LNKAVDVNFVDDAHINQSDWIMFSIWRQTVDIVQSVARDLVEEQAELTSEEPTPLDAENIDQSNVMSAQPETCTIKAPSTPMHKMPQSVSTTPAIQHVDVRFLVLHPVILSILMSWVWSQFKLASFMSPLSPAGGKSTNVASPLEQHQSWTDLISALEDDSNPAEDDTSALVQSVSRVRAFRLSLEHENSNFE
jgi:hypothetical protein